MQARKEGISKLRAGAFALMVSSSLVMLILATGRDNNHSFLSSLLGRKPDIGCLQLNLVSGTIQTEKLFDEPQCFSLIGAVGQELTVETDVQVILVQPSSASRTFSGANKISLLAETYQLRTKPDKENKAHEIKFLLSRATAASPTASNQAPQIVVPEGSYNVKENPPFKSNQKLQKIVDNAVDFIQRRGLSEQRLSISLVDLNDPSYSYAGYQDQSPRFPASVPKLFWMVALYGQYASGLLADGTVPESDVYKMIQKSDNEPASRVVDQLTLTSSGEELSPVDLQVWINKRLWINKFFENAGYQNINITQKNFPIPYLDIKAPFGRDLQMRQINSKSPAPFRNYLTTYNAARLLYEIDTDKAVSKTYSQKMKLHLQRDLYPDAWQDIEYNSIKGFLGEYLPVDTSFASKVGWTSDSRGDAAIIATPDGKSRYILVILSEGKEFANDWDIFPKVSRMIYDQMLTR